MRELFESILDKFKQDVELYNLLDGHMYVDRAPQKDMPEYVALHLIDLIPDQEFEYGRRLEIARVQFSIRSQSSDSTRVMEMFKAITAVYDRAVLLFRAQNYRSVMMSREMAILVKEPDNFWNYAVDYVVTLQPVTTTTSAP